MDKILFDGSDEKETELMHRIADMMDTLENEGIPKRDVIQSGVRYFVTLSYLMATTDSVDDQLVSIREDAVRVKESALENDVDTWH